MFNIFVVVIAAVVIAMVAFIACLMCEETYDETLVKWDGQKN